METAPRAQRLREVHRQADRGNHSGHRHAIRCCRAGSMDWDARPCSPPTPRRAGRRTGSPGRATTNSGRMLRRDLLPHAQAGEATVEFDSANGDLVVDYRLGRDVEEPAKIPEIFVFGPDGFQKPIAVKKIAAGQYRGRLQIGDRAGIIPRPSAGRIARVSRSGSVSARSRDGGLSDRIRRC